MILAESLRPFALTALVAPPLSLLMLAGAMVVSRTLPERRVHQLLAVTLSLGLVCTTVVAVPLITGLMPPMELDLGPVLAVRGYHFDLAMRLDAPGIAFLWLDFLLCGLVGAFSAPYLHQDEGFHRFYLLMMFFVVGLELVAVGAGLDLLFAGWELLGLSSALLIAFFYRRAAPVENGLRAYAVYRTTDVGILLAVVLTHHTLGTTSIAALPGLDAEHALMIGGLLVFGAMGKGAIVPFTPWLPRAMEGPTPSSAIFYGALSVHASPFLLLRAGDLIQDSLVLRGVVVALGLLTAAHATMVGRTQTDIKTSLGYASVTQVGVIWIEIGLGLPTLALFHLMGHAVLRTWQLLRAPSLLHDRHMLAVSLGASPGPTGQHWERLLPKGLRRWGYRIALERWYLDELHEAVVGTFCTPFRWLDRADRAWSHMLDGDVEETAPAVEPAEVHGT